MLYNFAFDNKFFFLVLGKDSYSFAVLHGALYTCFLVLPHFILEIAWYAGVPTKLKIWFGIQRCMEVVTAQSIKPLVDFVCLHFKGLEGAWIVCHNMLKSNFGDGGEGVNASSLELDTA